MIFPGFDGGAEWGGSAFDPETRLLYVNANEMPWILEMLELPPPGRGGTLGARVYAQHCTVCHGVDRKGDPQGQFPPLTGLADRAKAKDVVALLENGKGVMPAFAFLSDTERAAVSAHVLGEREPDDAKGEAARAGRPYTHLGYNRFLDPEGYPAVKPPWGTLNAIDLDAGEIRLVGPARRGAGAHETRGSADRHRELRRADRHRRRPRVRGRDEGRALPRVRQGDREGPLGDRSCPPEATRLRRRTRRPAGSTSSSRPVEARWAPARATRTSPSPCPSESSLDEAEAHVPRPAVDDLLAGTDASVDAVDREGRGALDRGLVEAHGRGHVRLRA